MKAVNSKVEVRGPAPSLVQDNRWILTDLISKSKEEASGILESGIMGKTQ